MRIVRRTPAIDPDRLPESLHPVLRRVYANRGIVDAPELDLSLSRLPGYESFKGIDAAVDRLADAVVHGRRILVVGDFDADGASATALAVDALRRMGATDVGYLVPDRFRHGYGLSPAIVEVAKCREPDLIVTVDNGISSLAGVEAANAAGIEVVITDHHLPGPSLPPAAAIVNPNQPGCGFPGKGLAGVGVVFYVLSALRGRLREAGHFGSRDEPAMADYLDLVALGTVADLVPLDGHNRVLVAQGLRRVRAGRSRAGLVALAEVSGRDPAELTSVDIAYALAPRLNAAGRMEDMGQGIACLLESDPERARAQAARLHALNAQRRERQDEMQAEALAAVSEAEARLTGDLPLGLCVAADDWHQGIVGLVAGRVREHYHRPVVAFAPETPGDPWLKGSARSIPGVHIRDVLETVAARHPGLIERFGGHAMAAGLTLASDCLDSFRQAFAEEVARWVSADHLADKIDSDGALDADELTLETAGALRDGGPWGQGFPEPVFDGRFEVVEQRVVGEAHLKMRVVPTGGGPILDAIAFRRDTPVPEGQSLTLAYRPDVNRFQGTVSLQLIVEHIDSG